MPKQMDANANSTTMFEGERNAPDEDGVEVGRELVVIANFTEVVVESGALALEL